MTRVIVSESKRSDTEIFSNQIKPLYNCVRVWTDTRLTAQLQFLF